MIDSSSYPLSVQILALTRFGGISPRLLELLFQHYVNSVELFNAPEQALLALPGMTKGAAAQVKRAGKSLDKAKAYYDDLVLRHVAVSTRFDDLYSHRLFELNDPPSLLYAMGRFPDTAARCVTLVGSDRASAEGIAWSTSLSKSFTSAGIQIVSSLSGGNDAAVHLACRAAGGKSYAVIDKGFEMLDGLEERALAADIALAGGVISEYPPETPQTADYLPAANRLLACYGQAVVFSELYHDSVRAHDLLEFCGLIGKLAVMTVDPVHGPLADRESLDAAVKHGAVILQGPNQVSDIIRSLA